MRQNANVVSQKTVGAGRERQSIGMEWKIIWICILYEI